ncbi:uncharacterized protein LOC117141006 isoform X2 [Drosophila mauritiana]|uniref:Uncharacterized protein LOC117141006 isoform X2 n=1 Tax=Drosophila mauritiana TaxID=7226 RepID=A0A6P8JVL1_DROMA|nr:uncharacterized protein LOC117141006 isoform X2 [Drosophila mauritiana]
MEETEILKNQNVPQTDKMKAASAHCEHNELHFRNHSYSEDSKESFGQMSLEQNKFNAVKNLTKQQSNLQDSEESPAQENTDERTKTTDEIIKPTETEERRDISSNEKETKYFVLNNSNESKEQCQEEVKLERNKCNELIIDKISDETIIPKTKAKSQVKLNDAASDKTLTIEMTRKSRQLIAEETLNNPKEESSNVVENLPSPPEKPVKEEPQEAKEQDTTIPQSEEVNIEKLDQMEASTSSAAHEAEMEKPNAVMPGKEDYVDPREKIRKDMEEYFSGIQALEVKTIRDELSAKEAEVILREDQRKRTWKAMLLSVTHTTTSTGKPPKSAVQAIPQRTAKADFKRKMYVLKENYNYRLELLKQLKNDMKNNYKSEAQQLYIDYHSIKNQTLNSPPLKEMLDANEE